MTTAAIHYSLRWLAFQLGIPLDVLCDLADHAEDHYHPFRRKSRNGKQRWIDRPDRQMSAVQTVIRNTFLIQVPLSPIVHGCVRGRSHVSNAAVHVKSAHLASVDVKDFYPKVTNKMVYTIFCNVIGLGPEPARLLTRLTTRAGHLPQGAPTSDALANIYLTPVDRQVELISSERGLRPSRYVDNYDFDGRRASEAVGPTIDALRRLGLGVRHKKTHHAGPCSPHVVTGLTVNGPRPSVSRIYRDTLRSEIYDLIAARARRDDTRILERSLRGKLINVSRTNPGFARRMRRHLADARIAL